MKTFVLGLIAFAALAQTPAQRIGAVLDDWHRAASVADEARYFGHFAPNGIFMGTDATEHWTVAQFREWAKPQFKKKSAWSFKPRDRHVDFSADGKTAWFDEMLDTPNLGVCRGSGVLVLQGGTWKIAQYNLSIAIPNALADSVVKLIGAKADGSTALHWASYRDDLDSADRLIRAGADVNAANDLGVTPLWPASENGSLAMVRKLLAAGANPNAALLSGETPVMVAARSGFPDVVEQLLSKGANPNARGSRGQTALMWAVSQKHPAVLKVLLAHYADIQLKSDVWSEVMAVPPHGYLGYNKAIAHGGETALMFAARVGELESAKLLVAAGADVNDADAWGVSATTLAAHSGFRELVEFFLARGADPNAAPNGFTALHEAVMRRDEKMVGALLEHHADPNAPLKTWTPTRRSSEDFHFEPSLIGATPFWLAARYLEPGVMRMLVAHGADPLFVLHVSWVASQGTGQQERAETASALLAATGVLADNGNRDSGGASAWVAPDPAERESLTLETVKLALELGVDVNAKDNDGRTALDGAKNLKYESVVSFLVGKGAKAGTGFAVRGRGRAADR